MADQDKPSGNGDKPKFTLLDFEKSKATAPPAPDDCADWRAAAWVPSVENIAAACEANAGADFHYVGKHAVWRVWEDGVWRDDDLLRLNTVIRASCRDIAETKKRSFSMKIANGQIGVIERLMRGTLAMRADRFDRDDWLINTPGGAIDLKAGSGLRPHRREDFCTRITACSPDWQCPIPLWLGLLDFVSGGDGDFIAYLQRALGYSMTGSTREQCMFFAHGRGNNGKSALLSTVAGILGNYAATAGMRTFTVSKTERHSEEWAVMRDARMVLASENDRDTKLPVSVIKQITGGERISARLMRENSEEWLPHFKCWLAGNNQPELPDADFAMRRRIQMIPFRHVLTDIDKDFVERVEPEWPGILAWMIDGALRYLDEGLRPPPVVVEDTAEYFAEQDVLQAFLDAECDCDPLATISTPSAVLFARFKSWARDYGSDGEITSTTKLTQSLKKKGFIGYRQWIGGRQVRSLRGIALHAWPESSNSGGLV